MGGPAGHRVSTLLPATDFHRFATIPYNPFGRNILPATYSFQAACTGNPSISMKTRNFGGGGEGTPCARVCTALRLATTPVGT
jgi:hypothetical protein